MEVNEQTLGVLKGLLTNVLSHDNAVRRNAESYLEQHEAQPGFPLLILTLITQLMAPITPQDIAIRQSASVLFKNVVKKHWVPEEDDKQGIVEQDKVLIRNNVVELMTTAPSDVQKQLAEAVTIISKHDFPQNWTNLLPQLTTMLSRQDIMVNKGVMLTANSIMKRFRYVFKSDALFEEILLCLQQFAVPLLQEFKRNGDLIVQLAGSIPQLEVLFETQRLIGRIYYSLNWQDIPEVFEDSATEWMTEFAKYLSYSNAVLVDNDEEHESGPIEKLQAAILENIALYANKYEEVFEPFLPQFTQLVWKLLMEVDTKPKYDILATSAIKFLTSVSSKQHNVGIFNENVLRDIVQQIVIKNLTATENDEELFEDNPIEYIRKDMEGSDQDSRRRCAMELVRALMKFFGPQISQLCQVYIDSLLQDYAKTKDWRCKDTALHLVLAVAIQSGTTTTGATELNPAINLMAIFDQHVLSELQQADVNHNEIVKADVIKVICVFRALLPSPMLLHVLPHLVRYLQSKHVVIQTYAAMCIERFLTIKESGSTTKNPLMKISKNDIIPHFQPLFGGLFAVLENPTLSENDYVMKCIMRALIVIGEDINAVLELVLSHLIKALEKVCKNPINPHYNHYLFECLALLVRSACGTGTTATMTDAQAAACSRFEVLLFPIFQQVLAMDVTEFVPYVFQILAQLLNARPANSGLSDAYRALFTPLLSPALWERKGNTPALVDLYKAYLSRGMKEIIAGNHLTGVLGVFQKLLSSKSTEVHAFNILNAIYGFCTIDVLQPYIVTIFNLLLHRLQESVKQSKKVPFCKYFIHNICLFSAVYGSQTLYNTLESLTNGLVTMLVMNIWSENRGNCAQLDSQDIKHILIGGTKLLCETPIATNIEVFSSLFHSLLVLVSDDDEVHGNYDLHVDDNAEDRAFDSTYSKLAYAMVPNVDPCLDVTSGPVYFVTTLANFTRSRPGQYGHVISTALNSFGTSSASLTQTFQGLLQQHGLSLA